MNSISYKRFGKLLESIGFKRSILNHRKFIYSKNGTASRMLYYIEIPKGNSFTYDQVDRIMSGYVKIPGFDVKKFCDGKYSSIEIELRLLV